MTRITFGTYRNGVRDPSFRFVPGGPAQTWASPTSIQKSAIVRHHRDGPAEARAYLVDTFERSPFWGPTGRPQNRGKARATIRSYDNYARLTRDDNRPMFATSVERDLEISTNALGTRIDVLLLDPMGYVPRLVLWDTYELTVERAQLYAAPVLLVTEQELGEGRTAQIEIVNARQEVREVVSPEDAESAVSEMGLIISRIVALR
jgi:hypothetical protein